MGQYSKLTGKQMKKRRYMDIKMKLDKIENSE